MQSSTAEEAVVKLDLDPSPPAQAWKGGWPVSITEFESLVETYQDRLVRYAFRRLGNSQDAEDVIQEVFVRAYKSPPGAKRVKNVGAYLYRMAANACTDLLRRRKHSWREIPLDDAATDEPIAENRTSPSEVIAATEELRRINRIMESLPYRQAEVIRFRVFDELAFGEIAEILGCTVATVKSRFRYGLEKLRTKMSREWEVSP